MATGETQPIDDGAGPFRRVSGSGATSWSGLKLGEPADLLERVFALEPDAFLRRMPGRETFRWPGEARVVKRMTGDPSRDDWFDRLRGRVPSPGRREADALAGLRDDGLPVPEVLGWAEESTPGSARRSVVVMERVPFSETLRQRLARTSGDEVRPWTDALLELVVRLHERGWIHRDLYLQHIVVRSAPSDGGAGPELVLLDVGRARRLTLAGPDDGQHRRRWYVKDLAALFASTPDNVPPRECMRFLAKWLSARGIHSARARRRWAKRVERRAHRMRMHTPRHLDPSDPVDAEFLEREEGQRP